MDISGCDSPMFFQSIGDRHSEPKSERRIKTGICPDAVPVLIRAAVPNPKASLLFTASRLKVINASSLPCTVVVIGPPMVKFKEVASVTVMVLFVTEIPLI